MFNPNRDPAGQAAAPDVAVPQEYGNSKSCLGGTPASRPSRPSPLEEMEKHLAHHDESFGRIAKGAAFLREHPEFNEFIQLIRTGSIGI